MKKGDGMQGPVPTPTTFAPGGFAASKNPDASSGARVVTGAEGFPGTAVPDQKGQMSDDRKPVVIGTAKPDGGAT